MKLILASLLASVLSAQTIWQVPLWTGKTYQFPTLGKSFVIQNGVVEILPQPSQAVHKHVVGVLLTPTNGVYTIPANATNLQLFRNGVRQFAGGDYTLTGGTITTLLAWGAGNLVVADYEIP